MALLFRQRMERKIERPAMVSVSTTGRYDRRDDATQRGAAAELHVPYAHPED